MVHSLLEGKNSPIYPRKEAHPPLFFSLYLDSSLLSFSMVMIGCDAAAAPPSWVVTPLFPHHPDHSRSRALSAGRLPLPWKRCQRLDLKSAPFLLLSLPNPFVSPQKKDSLTAGFFLVHHRRCDPFLHSMSLFHEKASFRGVFFLFLRSRGPLLLQRREKESLLSLFAVQLLFLPRRYSPSPAANKIEPVDPPFCTKTRRASPPPFPFPLSEDISLLLPPLSSLFFAAPVF